MFTKKNCITSSTTINITVYFWYTRNNFLLPVTWQKEKHYVLKVEQGFLDGVYTEFQTANFAHCHIVTKIKERAKVFRANWMAWKANWTMLSFKLIESNYSRKEPCEQGCSSFLIFWTSDTVNIVLLFFQPEMTVHAARTKKKICEVNNFWYFFKKS